jgi:hypothetical protein
MKQHLDTLLEWQILYWKQSGTLKWMTCGDAGTTFSHANATIMYRQNFITTLEDNSSSVGSRHEEKTNLLWEAYKQRLGTSDFSHMYFDLNSI